jgi:hypothetical protein
VRGELEILWGVTHDERGVRTSDTREEGRQDISAPTKSSWARDHHEARGEGP